LKNNAPKNSQLNSLTHCNTKHNEDSISRLEQEIASIEEDLKVAESQVRSIKSQIQSRYHNEILRINELYLLYKKQKQLKKVNRFEQKKRGKNYKEPVGLKKSATIKSADLINTTSETNELKKLYREAVLQVHPDKFANHPEQMSKRSQELTIQLIDLYQSGNIEKLKHMHRHIMSGNAMAGHQENTVKVPDPAAMKQYLIQKRDTIVNELKEIRESYFYRVFTTNNNVSEFIDNMAVQFYLRIKQLERRTRS
jgi:hypothetical protein